MIPRTRLYGKKATESEMLCEITSLLTGHSRPYPLRPVQIAQILRVSRQTIYQYIKILLSQGVICKDSGGQLILPKNNSEFKRFNKVHPITSDPLISACGGITAKVGTIYGTQHMGLSSVQPFIDQNIVLYNTTLDSDVTEFTVFVENKKHDFNEKYYTRGNDLTRVYSGTTGYTSQQQGTFSVFSETASEQQITQLDAIDSIPVWIKNNAEWWADDTIDDDTFTTSIEFLINENIISVSANIEYSPDSDSIPVWIKNNAEWWSDGIIDDETFLNGVEYLVENGIISVN